MAGVRTYLQSGNVIAQSQIQAPAEVSELVRKVIAAEIDAQAAERPRLVRVIFLAAVPAAEMITRLTSDADLREICRVVGRHVYVDYVRGYHTTSRTANFYTHALGVEGTERNWQTVLALPQLARASRLVRSYFGPGDGFTSPSAEAGAGRDGPHLPARPRLAPAARRARHGMLRSAATHLPLLQVVPRPCSWNWSDSTCDGSRGASFNALAGHGLLALAAKAVSDECPLAEDEEEPLSQLSRLWKGPLDWLEGKISKKVATFAPVGFPTQDGSRELSPDAQAALLAVYAGQFGSYTTLLWQVPALSLTAQAFLFTIALARDSDPAARIASGILSVITSLMSIYLMLSHRIHAERQARVAMDIALQLGAQRAPEKDHRGAAGVWAGVNRGSFALWILGLGLFGMVGLGTVILGLSEL